MDTLLDLERYPLDRPSTPAYARLVGDCQRQLAANGSFNLDGFVRPAAIQRAAAEILPLARHAYTHQRTHNVYFKDTIEGLPAGHPALTRFDTVHHTLCDDQIQETIIHRIYEWQPLAAFLAKAMQQPELHQMADPLARVNVIEYRPGETLNWHFDRSRFTTTLLVQAAEAGGEFEYCSGLRSDEDPNYEGVGRLLQGKGGGRIGVNALAAGTLNVFAGRNTLHRVTKVRGALSRLVAVYSYYDRPGVMFSDEERRGFYGRAA
ncbi:MAG: 2OG-Fe(II) oxygenase [Proteobacteria bacterium]|nr:2OG-Fe(II) oxygenase [Pseudomonadota bacterium]